MRNARKLSIVAGSLLVSVFIALVLFGPTEQPKRTERANTAAPRAASSAPTKLVAPAAVVAVAKPAATVAPRVDAPAVRVEQGPSAPAPVLAAPGPSVDSKAVASIREGLRNPDPKVRLASVRAVRGSGARDLEADVALLLEKEKFVPVRRVAAQVLALGDAPAHEQQLRDLKKDPDVIVQLNACYGLARTGDETEQGLLIAFCEASRGAPKVLPMVAAALEDPALRSPAVIARFQMVAEDPKVDPVTRDHARQVIKAKRS